MSLTPPPPPPLRDYRDFTLLSLRSCIHTYTAMLQQAARYATYIHNTKISIAERSMVQSSSCTHIRITWHNDITDHKTCFIGCDRDEIILSIQLEELRFAQLGICCTSTSSATDPRYEMFEGILYRVWTFEKLYCFYRGPKLQKFGKHWSSGTSFQLLQGLTLFLQNVMCMNIINENEMKYNVFRYFN